MLDPSSHPPPRPLRRVVRALPALLAAGLGACERRPRPDAPRADTPAPTASTAAAPAAKAPARKPAPAPRPVADMRLEVDTRARRLAVFRGGSRVATYPIAVGSPEWPTRHGSWQVVQVIWNPEWHPPEESWADGLRHRGPGDPDNPLGRVQIVYDPPRTIHGTNHPASIGKAVSHGSIRMGDAAIARLARDVMAAAGAGHDSAWVARVRARAREKVVVDLPRVVPIRVF